MLRVAALHFLLGRIQRFSTIGHPIALVACLALSAAEMTEVALGAAPSCFVCLAENLSTQGE